MLDLLDECASRRRRGHRQSAAQAGREVLVGRERARALAGAREAGDQPPARFFVQWVERGGGSAVAGGASEIAGALGLCGQRLERVAQPAVVLIARLERPLVVEA